MAAALIGGALAAYGANKAASSAKSAAKQQAKGIERGITESEGYYDEGQNYLAPYTESGAKYGALLDDIIGVNGPEAQAAALEMYKGSPSASLLDTAREEAVRRTQGQWAAAGGSNSGRMVEDLGRRTADLDLANYHQWQELPKGMYSTGVNAAGAAANLAGHRSGQILGARSGQGTAQASGTIGAANAQLAGMNAAGNYLGYALGKTDFSNAFGGQKPGTNFLTQAQQNQLNGYF